MPRSVDNAESQDVYALYITHCHYAILFCDVEGVIK